MNGLEYIAEPVHKKTMRVSLELLQGRESLAYRSGKSSIQLLEDVILSSIFVTFPMHQFDVLFEAFQEKALRLSEAGLSLKSYSGSVVTKLVDDEVPPLVLTMADLNIGFIVCLITLALSVLAFILEVTIPWARSTAKSIKEKVIAAAIVLTFYKMKRDKASTACKKIVEKEKIDRTSKPEKWSTHVFPKVTHIPVLEEKNSAKKRFVQ